MIRKATTTLAQIQFTEDGDSAVYSYAKEPTAILTGANVEVSYPGGGMMPSGISIVRISTYSYTDIWGTVLPAIIVQARASGAEYPVTLNIHALGIVEE